MVGEGAPGVPLQPDQVVRIGSVTKTFVAAATVVLADEGALDLDAPVDTWVSDVPNGDLVTVRMALNHASGIFNYTNDTEFFGSVLADPMRVWAPEELIAVAAQHPPYFEPGASWEYSNTNYIVLGRIIESVTGSPLEEVLRTRFLIPNGLDSTWLDGARAPHGELAHGYLSNKTDATTRYDQSWAWAAGAMVSSPEDLLRWSRALYAGSVLSPAAHDAMFDTVPTGVPGLEYGLGMFRLSPSVAYVDTVGHMGDTLGYHTHMFYLVDEDISVVSAVLSDGADVNAITGNAVQILTAP